MISLTNIYKFALHGEQSSSQEENVHILCENLSKYFESEGLIFKLKNKTFSPNYSVRSFVFEKDFWKMHIFYKTGPALPYFYPEVFCEVWLDEKMIADAESRKKTIFFLSNSFECFEFFDEKNLMIEFHESIRETIIKRDFMQGKKKFSLRFDFIDIGQIGNLDEKYNEKLFKSFIEQKWELGKTTPEIKQESPENYRTLLVFLYHIFSLTKNLKRTTLELQKIKKYEEKNGENIHIDLSQERLQMIEKNTKKVLEKYKQVFESFFEIH